MPTDNMNSGTAAGEQTASAMGTINAQPQMSSFSTVGTPKAPDNASEIMKQQFQNAMDTVQRTLNRHRRGETSLPLNPGLGTIGNGGLKNSLMGLFNPATIPSTTQPSAAPQPPSMAAPSAPTTMAPKSAMPKDMTRVLTGGAAAQQNGVSMMGSIMSEGQSPFYLRNGENISLPPGIDLNDDAAVSAAIQETNALLDRFDRAANMED